ncbi:hypothetical protein [Sansalvadorimonas verongulae]|nr:hypothetical protein [Sansalvadorimonas verongulae]
MKQSGLKAESCVQGSTSDFIEDFSEGYGKNVDFQALTLLSDILTE